MSVAKIWFPLKNSRTIEHKSPALPAFSILQASVELTLPDTSCWAVFAVVVLSDLACIFFTTRCRWSDPCLLPQFGMFFFFFFISVWPSFKRSHRTADLQYSFELYYCPLLNKFIFSERYERSPHPSPLRLNKICGNWMSLPLFRTRISVCWPKNVTRILIAGYCI